MIANLSILIIENQKQIAQNMRISLEEMGYDHIRIAPSNRQAVKSLKKDLPDIVFMDILLEDNSSTVRTAHQITDKQHIPLVYVSTDHEISSVNTFYSDNHPVIITPLDKKQLRKSIESVIKNPVERNSFHMEPPLKVLLDHCFDAVIIVDKKGLIMAINKSTEKILNVNKNKLLNQNFSQWIKIKNSSNKKLFPNSISPTFIENKYKVKNQTANLILQEQVQIPIEFSMHQIDDHTAFIFRKSLNKLKKTSFKKNKNQYQSILENMMDGIIFVDKKGIVREVNTALCELLGIPRSDLIGQNGLILVKTLLKGKDLTRVASFYKDMLSGKSIKPYELEYNNRLLEIRSPHSSGDLGFTILFHDITEKKAAEKQLYESVAKYKKIFEYANDGMLYFNTDGQIIDINSRALMILNVERSKIIHKHIRNLTFLSQEEISFIESRFEKTLQKDILSTKLSFHNRQGKKLHLECVSTRIMHRKKVNVVLIIMHDETERINQENQILTSLHEKEILLQEVHHRVKNNLQIISSLIHLQSFQFSDPRILDSIKQSQNRIRTMAVLHEQLYKADNFAQVDFEIYAKTLIRHLMNQYSSIRDQINIIMQIDKCDIGIENAVYCGLIINELISNAFKHAFLPGKQGFLFIILKKNPENEIELIVENDGIPFPETFDIRDVKTLGLRLVRLLSEDQMNGKLIFEKSPKTTFKVIFNRHKDLSSL